jgi:N-acetyltransferase 10
MPDLPPNTATARLSGDNAGTATNWKPVETSIQDELDEAGDEVTKGLREKQREMINSLDLRK